MSGNGPLGWSKPERRRLLLWPPAAGCLAVAVSNFRHGPDWSGWLVLVLGLSLLSTLVVSEVRTVLKEEGRPR